MIQLIMILLKFLLRLSDMIKTTYFNRYAREKLDGGVSIAISTPSWSGVEKVYEPLFPSWDMVNQYKKDGNIRAYNKSYITEILNKLDPQKVLKDLKEMNCKFIICWEKKGIFCHRHIVRVWLSYNIGEIIEEL